MSQIQMKVLPQAIPVLHDYIRKESREISEIRIEGSVSLADSTAEDWARQASTWKELSATHLSANTAAAGVTSVGVTSVQAHIEALRRFKEAVG